MQIGNVENEEIYTSNNTFTEDIAWFLSDDGDNQDVGFIHLVGEPGNQYVIKHNE